MTRSSDAERDLTDLFDYTAKDSGVERAGPILRRLDETLTNLAAWPRSGRVHHQLDGSPRVFAVWPWLIIYEPRPSGGGIFVWRIVDGRRDLPAIVRVPSRRS